MMETGSIFLYGTLVLLAGLISIECAVSVAIIEIVLGVLAGSFLGFATAPWLDFLAALGAIVLTFLAGAEVDTDVLRDQLKPSLLIGGFSFLAPFVGAWGFALFVLRWSGPASLIAGIALSTTSLAVVYAVLVETGLSASKLGQLIMAACFVTDFGTAVALNLFFVPFSWALVIFVSASALLITLSPGVVRRLFQRYAQRVAEPEIKLLLFALVAFMLLGDASGSHAVLPVFVFGLVLSKTMKRSPEVRQRLRTVAFALLTPAFFIKAGLNVSLGHLSTAIGPLVGLLLVKLAAKFAGVYPFARRYAPADAPFTTLLMSTGLTFGTISAMYGLASGIINRSQFSVLVTVVILTAVVPTLVAQRWFLPATAHGEDDTSAGTG